MKALAGVVAASALAGAVVISMGTGRGAKPLTAQGKGVPAPVNPYKGMREREEVYEFTTKPAVKKEGDKWVITFASKGKCDATVAILDAKGKIVRHLASGVLGVNAPHPFQQNSLSQKLEWDGLADDFTKAPAGCRVRVSLGLDARFERLEEQFLFPRAKALAVDKDGYLYYTTFATISESVHVFDRGGKYVRTILPNPSNLPPEQVSIVNWNKTAGDEAVPSRIRTGGGWQFNWDNVGGVFLYMKSHTAVVLPDGRLGLLATHWNRMATAKLLLLDTRTGAAPKGSVVELGKTSSAGMAVSPDGKWLYFSGMGQHHGGGPPCHAVMRTSAEKLGAPQPFAGEPGKAGSDNAHLSGPEGVACDKDGNVYVADTGNKRIQVFKPDGSHLKTIPDVQADAIAVHPKTGAIYVQHCEKYDLVITKLGGLANPAKVAEYRVNSGNYQRLQVVPMALDPTSDPASLWIVAHGRDFAVVQRIEDRGDKLVKAADALAANGVAKKNPGGRLASTKSYLEADRRAGKLVAWPGRLLSGGSNVSLGPDGYLYGRTQPPASKGKFWIIRCDPKTGKLVPFEHGEQAKGGYGMKPLVQDGKPVIGIPVSWSTAAHAFQNPFCVAPNGDLYVPAYVAKEYLPEIEKEGYPKPWKLGSAVDQLHVFSPDGKVKTRCALPGLTVSDGLRVGRSGAVYVIQGFKPLAQKGVPDGLAAGSKYEDSRWGSLIKFKGRFDRFPVGKIVGSWEKKPPASPTHHAHWWKVNLENAHWSYGGFSPLSARYASCTCLKASFDLDDYERSFVPAAQTCTVNVIDSNGNVVARFGGYGNLDSRGEDSPVLDPKTGALRPRRPDDPEDIVSPVRPLGFNLPRSVAVADGVMWVHDVGNRTIVRSRLFYHAEVELPLP